MLLAGVLLMVFRAAAVSVAENMQRYAQRPEHHNRLMNVLGVVLQVVSAPVDAIAYSIAPQSMLAPVGMLGLLFNMVAAQRIHGDPIAQGQVSATTCIAIGTLVCLSSGASDSSAGDIQLSASQLLAYATIIAPLCAMLLWLSKRDLQLQFPAAALASAMVCGTLGSSTVVASKVLGAAVQAHHPTILSVLLSAIPIAALAPLHLWIMNDAIGRHSLVFMSPASGSSGLIANVSTGFFLYGEVPESPIIFAAGVLLVAGGVASLCESSTRKKVATA